MFLISSAGANPHCLWERVSLCRALLSLLIPVPAPSLGGARSRGDHEGRASRGGSPGNTTMATHHHSPTGRGERPGAGPQASARTGGCVPMGHQEVTRLFASTVLPSSSGIREHPLQPLPALSFHL